MGGVALVSLIGVNAGDWVAGVMGWLGFWDFGIY